MDRFEQLSGIFADMEGEADVVRPMIEDVVFLEGRLTELRAMPFLRVNPKNPADQKPTAAARQYKELLQQYNNCIKILTGILRKTGQEEISPLRAYLDALEEAE